MPAPSAYCSTCINLSREFDKDKIYHVRCILNLVPEDNYCGSYHPDWVSKEMERVLGIKVYRDNKR